MFPVGRWGLAWTGKPGQAAIVVEGQAGLGEPGWAENVSLWGRKQDNRH